MKTIKKITTAILIITAIIILTDCKNVLIQTDKPLYDVLISHAWKTDFDNNRVYHFLPDSVCYENHDAENDSTHFENTKLFPNFSFRVKWWLEYNNNRTLFYINEIQTMYDTITDYNDEITVDSIVYSEEFMYSIVKYNEHKIKAYLSLPKISFSDSVSVILKALN